MLKLSSTVVLLLAGICVYLISIPVGTGVARVVLQSVGGFLIGTVVVSYAYELFMREEVEQRTVGLMDDVLSQRIDAIFPGANRFGFFGFAHAASRSVFDELEEGDELLWLDTYSPDVHLYRDALHRAVKRGARLRMLAIQPGCATLSMRAEEISTPGFDPSTFDERAQDFLEVLEGWEDQLQGAAGKLEIRTYNDLPGVPMYLHLKADRVLAGVTGFFLSEPSFDQVHIKWKVAPGGVLEDLRTHFERKWQRGAEVVARAESISETSEASEVRLGG